MNKFLATLCLAAGVFTFVACSSDSDDNGGESIAQPTESPKNYVTVDGLTLSANHRFVVADNNTEVTFKVTKNGVDVTNSSTIYYQNGDDNVKVENNSFVCSNAGAYKFWASNKTTNTRNNLLIVDALHALPTLAADSQVNSDDFLRNVLLLQATGVTCQYCPNAITAIKNFYAKNADADRFKLMTVHTFTSGDPLWSEGAEKLRIQAGISSYPTLLLNYNSEWLGSSMNSTGFENFLNNAAASLLKDNAETGISIATKYNPENGVISVNAAIKCDDPNKYRVTAALLQDNVFFRQTGTSDPSFYIHEAGVKAISPATGAGFALNNGDVTTENATYDFACEFNANALYAKGTGEYALDVVRDARVMIYVQANGKLVDNVAVCGMNQKVGFAYE
ncbi:MAG: Omp28-related outer membrane protein [Bacteroidaceae bacterium]|nr:Omp28-related outer membrane protein [Bacteroidaceae bacterium]